MKNRRRAAEWAVPSLRVDGPAFVARDVYPDTWGVADGCPVFIRRIEERNRTADYDGDAWGYLVQVDDGDTTTMDGERVYFATREDALFWASRHIA